MAKAKAAPAAPAPAPTVINAAPGYDPYARPAAPAQAGVTAPGGPYGGPAPSGGNGAVVVTAPPARTDQAPFINAQFLWQLGRPFRATITGLRDATGTGNTQFAKPGQPAKRGWFLDMTLEDGRKVTGRINEGDTRHQRLYASYQGSWVNRNVTLRLTTPGDIDAMTGRPSKAAWMLDCN